MSFWNTEKLVKAGLICSGKCLLLMCALGIAPFYPTEASARGCSSAQIGLVFACLPLVGFLLSPVVGKKINGGVPPKRVLIFGLIIEASFMLAFSFAEILKEANEFFGASLAFRSLQAVGVTSSSVAYNAVAAELFGDKMESFLPVLEMFAGLGVMVGPTVGGALYQVWGFRAPYTVFCVLIILFTMCLFKVLPPHREKSLEEKANIPSNCSWDNNAYLSMFCIDIAFNLFVLFLTFMSIAFNDSTLAIRLSDYDLSSFQTGLVFLVSAFMYSLSSLLAQRISNLFLDSRIWSVFGGALIGIGWIMMSSNYLVRTVPLGHVIAAQALIGFGAGIFYVVSCNHSYKHMTEKLGFPKDFTSYSLLSGCLQGSYFLGCLVGSAGGGLVIYYLNYEFCTFLFAVINFISMLFYTLLITKSVCQRKPKAVK